MSKNNLPVSKKVYADITLRISTTLSFSPSSVDEAIALVDAYLAGNPEPHTTDNAAFIAFSMIKAELDRAMSRSMRARQRAAKRKNGRKPETVKTEKEMVVKDVTDIAGSDKPAPEVMLSRRERRAMERQRSKSRRRNLYDRVDTLII